MATTYAARLRHIVGALRADTSPALREARSFPDVRSATPHERLCSFPVSVTFCVGFWTHVDLRTCEHKSNTLAHSAIVAPALQHIAYANVALRSETWKWSPQGLTFRSLHDLVLKQAFDPFFTLSLTSVLSLYKWKLTNTQHHLVVKQAMPFSINTHFFY